MVKDKLIRLLIEEEVADRYKQYCRNKGISVSDDLRTYILSVLEGKDSDPEENFSVSMQSAKIMKHFVEKAEQKQKNSGEEEIDPKTGFRRRVQFTSKGLILNPRTDAEKEYNRSFIS